MTEQAYRPLTEIITESLPYLAPLQIKRNGGSQPEKLRTFFYGGVDHYLNEKGVLVEGIRVFHDRDQDDQGNLVGILDDTSHLGNERRDEQRGILLTFGPSWEGYTFSYRRADS